MNPHPDHAHAPAHKHKRKPADLSYRFVVRTVLWVVAGVVYLGLAICGSSPDDLITRLSAPRSVVAKDGIAIHDVRGAGPDFP